MQYFHREMQSQFLQQPFSSLSVDEPHRELGTHRLEIWPTGQTERNIDSVNNLCQATCNSNLQQQLAIQT